LAPHKVPRSIVVVDAIPRTGRGKVDRAALDALDPRDDRA
jgi:acyl-CoA synthetase (AMP-forming)/AMP-acid ligase II